jgi:hypothetical protein
MDICSTTITNLSYASVHSITVESNNNSMFCSSPYVDLCENENEFITSSLNAKKGYLCHDS